MLTLLSLWPQQPRLGETPLTGKIRALKWDSFSGNVFSVKCVIDTEWWWWWWWGGWSSCGLSSTPGLLRPFNLLQEATEIRGPAPSNSQRPVHRKWTRAGQSLCWQESLEDRTGREWKLWSNSPESCICDIVYLSKTILLKKHTHRVSNSRSELNVQCQLT